MHAAGCECGLVVSCSVGFEQLQYLKECGGNFIEIEFRFDLEHGIEIGRCQACACEGIEFRPELGHIRGRHSEAAGMGMSAEAGEEIVRGLDGLKEVKRANGSAGTEGLLAFARDDDGGPVIALDH